MRIEIQNRLLVTALLAFAAQPACAVNITFDYTYDTAGFFDTARKSTLNQAGIYLGSRLQDQLTAINSSGSNNFTARFWNPSDGMGSVASAPSFNVAENAIRVYVGAADLGKPASTVLALAAPGGGDATGGSAFIVNTETRGQAGASGFLPKDFGPWGGSIAFNSNSLSNWYFDDDVSTVEAFSGFDFFTTAVHEIGHVLGFGSSASWNGRVGPAGYGGVHSMAAYGGRVPLNDLWNHWADGTMSTYNGTAQEAAMTPSGLEGQRYYFTELDFAGLKDIGWQVAAAPVPLPGALGLLFSGITCFAMWGRRHPSAVLRGSRMKRN